MYRADIIIADIQQLELELSMYNTFILFAGDLGKLQAAMLLYDKINVRLCVRHIYIIFQSGLDTAVAFYLVCNHSF